jgi:hypothetical protein
MWTLHRLNMEFMWSIWSPHSQCKLYLESTKSSGTVQLDSKWSLCGVYEVHIVNVDFIWSPEKVQVQSSWTLSGIYVESKWNVCGLCGVYVESMWTLNGMWLSVKYSQQKGHPHPTDIIFFHLAIWAYTLVMPISTWKRICNHIQQLSGPEPWQSRCWLHPYYLLSWTTIHCTLQNPQSQSCHCMPTAWRTVYFKCHLPWDTTVITVAYTITTNIQTLHLNTHWSKVRLFLYASFILIHYTAMVTLTLYG